MRTSIQRRIGPPFKQSLGYSKKWLLIGLTVLLFQCQKSKEQDFHYRHRFKDRIVGSEVVDTIVDISKFPLNDPQLFMGIKVGMSEQEVKSHIKGLIAQKRLTVKVEEYNPLYKMRPIRYFSTVLVPDVRRPSSLHRLKAELQVEYSNGKNKRVIGTSVRYSARNLPGIAIEKIPESPPFPKGTPNIEDKAMERVNEKLKMLLEREKELSKECCDEFNTAYNNVLESLIQFYADKYERYHTAHSCQTIWFMPQKYIWVHPSLFCERSTDDQVWRAFKNYKLDGEAVEIALIEYEWVNETKESMANQAEEVRLANEQMMRGLKKQAEQERIRSEQQENQRKRELKHQRTRTGI